MQRAVILALILALGCYAAGDIDIEHEAHKHMMARENIAILRSISEVYNETEEAYGLELFNHLHELVARAVVMFSGGMLEGDDSDGELFEEDSDAAEAVFVDVATKYQDMSPEERDYDEQLAAIEAHRAGDTFRARSVSIQQPSVSDDFYSAFHGILAHDVQYVAHPKYPISGLQSVVMALMADEVTRINERPKSTVNTERRVTARMQGGYADARAVETTYGDSSNHVVLRTYSMRLGRQTVEGVVQQHGPLVILGIECFPAIQNPAAPWGV